MRGLAAELAQAQRPGSVTEQLAMLLACGISAQPPCLQSFLLRELREEPLDLLLREMPEDRLLRELPLLLREMPELPREVRESSLLSSP